MGNDPAIIDEMLRTAKTIAVVGMSDKPLARQPQHRPLSGRRMAIACCR